MSQFVNIHCENQLTTPYGVESEENMLVSDLIALLEKCHQSMEVYIETPDRDRDYFCDGVHVDNNTVFLQTAE